jgi:hypothetical protein
MAARIWPCCVVVTLMLLGHVESQEEIVRITSCEGAIFCLDNTVAYGGSNLIVLGLIDSPADRERFCDTITSPTVFDAHLNFCLPDDIDCSTEDVLAEVKARQAEVNSKLY